VYDVGTDNFRVRVPFRECASALDLRPRVISLTRDDSLWKLQDASQFRFLRYFSALLDSDGGVELVVIELHSYVFWCDGSVRHDDDVGSQGILEFGQSNVYFAGVVLYVG
jgi:hypothetical protein